MLNCIRQPGRQLLSSPYNHNTLTTFRTSVRKSTACTLRAWKFTCNDSFTDVLTETTNLVLQSGTKVKERLEQECEVCDKALVVRNLPVVKTSSYI